MAKRVPGEEGANEVATSERKQQDDAAVHSDAVAYLITFTTYGTWLHGDQRGSVDPRHDVYDAPVVGPSAVLRSHSAQRLSHPKIHLDTSCRGIVQRTIEEVCEYKSWTVHALDVRTNHIHVVVSAPDAPERIMNTLKSWATRRMSESGAIKKGTKVWTRHGSTRYLWNTRSLRKACEYVAEQQGGELTH